MGLNGTNYNSDGHTAFLSNHLDPTSIKNYFALYGMEGTSMNQVGKGSYYMDGVKAGSIYAQMGQTGISGGKHVDFGIYQTGGYTTPARWGTKVEFSSIFPQKLDNPNGYNYKVDALWAQKYSGKTSKSTLSDLYIQRYLYKYWFNQPNYSGIIR